MRCPRCGNENSDANRFCGMCGATLLSAPPLQPRKTQPISAAPAPEVPAPRPQIVEPTRAAAPEAHESRASSAPSFLGLNDPAPAKRANLSVELPASGTSRNLDYLLEDEEPKSGGGWIKYVVILLALALAAGLGYWRWKDQAFGWLNSGTKPAASTTNSNTNDAGSSASADSTPANTATNKSAAPAADSPPTSGSTNPNSDAPANPSASSTSPPGASNTGAGNTTAGNTSTAPAADSAASAATDAAKPADQPKPADDQPAPKPSASARPAKPFDSVAESDKYLYGHGVRQDCDRGLRMLKPAANAGNPKATMEMGGLYSSGTCVPRDLPTAYRWYALTLHKEPDNQAAQAALQKLWAEMTQPERQLAIKLTQ